MGVAQLPDAMSFVSFVIRHAFGAEQRSTLGTALGAAI